MHLIINVITIVQGSVPSSPIIIFTSVSDRHLMSTCDGNIIYLHIKTFMTFKELNISEHSLDQLATDAMLQTRLLQNNPRELEWQQAREIYQAIYS